MKRIIILLCLLISVAFNCLAQQGQLPEKGGYIKYDHLKAYEGKWKYEAGEEAFVLTLTLKKARLGTEQFYFYMDQLQGEISYTKSGKQIIDRSANSKRIVIESTAQHETDVVELLFMDPVKDKSGEVTLKFVNDTNKLLQWELKEHAELLIRSISKKHKPGFSVPTKMLLRRVE